jgi:riboflavin kinase
MQKQRPTICGPAEGPAEPYPVKLKGLVTKGYGRGSSELGIPTANLPEDVASLASLETGIYYGYASVGDDVTVRSMVMSYGWNPFYKNKIRSAEVTSPRLIH